MSSLEFQSVSAGSVDSGPKERKNILYQVCVADRTGDKIMSFKGMHLMAFL